MPLFKSRMWWLLLVVGIALLPGSTARADDFTDSDLSFDSPGALAADTAYEFYLTVYNAETFQTKEKVGEWIYAVDLTLPSSDYVVNTEELDSPNPLHTGMEEGPYRITAWEVSFDPSSSTISWECFSVATSATYGDIREQEMLSFNFVATTDSDATDGFPWILYGDLGTDVEGVAYIGETTDDDDAGDDDDDTGDDDSGSDDDMDDWDPEDGDEMGGRTEEDESSGCGC